MDIGEFEREREIVPAQEPASSPKEKQVETETPVPDAVPVEA